MLVQLLVLLWLVIEDHDNLFIMAESVHFLGIGLLIYKLMTKKSAGGAHPPFAMLPISERQHTCLCTHHFGCISSLAILAAHELRCRLPCVALLRHQYSEGTKCQCWAD